MSEEPDPEPEYVVVARISVDDLAAQVQEGMTDAARMGIGEAIMIVERHREIADDPAGFDAVLDELRQYSATFSFENASTDEEIGE